MKKFTTCYVTDASCEHGSALLFVFSSDVSAFHSHETQDEGQHSNSHPRHEQSPHDLKITWTYKIQMYISLSFCLSIEKKNCFPQESCHEQYLKEQRFSYYEEHFNNLNNFFEL